MRKAASRAFIKRIQNFAHQESLFRRGDGLLLAVSGGADSLCLLDVMAYLSKKYAFTLHAAHVNYGLRGKDSDADEALVREECARQNILLHVLHPRITGKSNLEERLRDIRYRFFEQVRGKYALDSIVIAHHQDDQAETFLMRLLRGSGLSGLSSMEPRSETLVRPFLETSRADILAYMKREALPYREDATNLSPDFLRNRIRNKLLPLLAEEYQPNIRILLAKTARSLASEKHLLRSLLPELKTLTKTASGAGFSRQEFLALPPEARKQTLRSLLAFWLPTPPSRNLLQELEKSLKSGKNKPQTVRFRGLILERKGDKVRLLKSDSSTL